jgi:hypothetical protein
MYSMYQSWQNNHLQNQISSVGKIVVDDLPALLGGRNPDEAPQQFKNSEAIMEMK